MKSSGRTVLHKNHPQVNCPFCGNEMDNLNLNKKEAMILKLTFGLIASEKYRCFGCLTGEQRRISNNFRRKRRVRISSRIDFTNIPDEVKVDKRKFATLNKQNRP